MLLDVGAHHSTHKIRRCFDIQNTGISFVDVFLLPTAVQLALTGHCTLVVLSRPFEEARESARKMPDPFGGIGNFTHLHARKQIYKILHSNCASSRVLCTYNYNYLIFPLVRGTFSYKIWANVRNTFAHADEALALGKSA